MELALTDRISQQTTDLFRGFSQRIVIQVCVSLGRLRLRMSLVAFRRLVALVRCPAPTLANECRRS